MNNSSATGSIVKLSAYKPENVEAVANYFIYKSILEGVKDLNLSKLNKLIYFAYGWFAGCVNQPLVAQIVMADQFGPYFFDVKKQIKASDDAINQLLLHYHTEEEKNKALPPFPVDGGLTSFLDHIWREYHKFTPQQLSALVQTPASPWYKVKPNRLEMKQKKIKIIPYNIIEEYYVNLYEENLYRQKKS